MRTDVDHLRQTWSRLLQQPGPYAPEEMMGLFEQIEPLVVRQPQEALALFEALQADAQARDHAWGQAFILGFEGYARYLTSAHMTALPCLKESMRRLQELGDEYTMAYVRNALAGVEQSLGNYEQALAHAFASLEYVKRIGKVREEAWLLHGIGGGFQDLGDYARARTYMEESLARFEHLGDDPIGTARALSGLGTVLNAQGTFADALPLLERSLGLFQAEENDLGEARALNDLGITHRGLGNLAQAQQCHERSLALRRKVGNRQAQSTSLIHLGWIYLANGEKEAAEQALCEALAIAEDIEAKPRQWQAHEALAALYEAQDNYRVALYHQKTLHEIKESVFNEEAQARMRNLQVSFETDQAVRDAAMQRQQNEALRTKNEELETLLTDLQTTQAQLVQAEKLASLGQLTAGIAHEIKNPLNFITNFAALSQDLLDELADALGSDTAAPPDEATTDILEDLRHSAKKIETHGRRADQIIRGMMAHARGGSGESESHEINAFVEEYANLAYHGARAQWPAFRVDLAFDLDPQVGTVPIFRQDLGRVLINLLSNAFFAVQRRYESDGGDFQPQIWLRTAKEKATVRIEVRDNGCGIPAEVQARIFEPFFTTKPTGEGTGLGLSLSHEIVAQQHGGTLTCTSTEGAGTTFTIRLPHA